MKNVAVNVAGSGQIHDLQISPGTTAADILKQINLPDYLLSKGPNQDFFANAESVYDKINDGEKVFASTKAQVGYIQTLDIRYNPKLRRLPWAAAQPPHRAQRVERQQIPYWQQHSWTRNGNEFSGRYNTSGGAFEGWVEQRSHKIDFYIKHPTARILNSSHGPCFQPRSEGWYFVHMSQKPQDVSSGIMAVESMLADALGR